VDTDQGQLGQPRRRRGSWILFFYVAREFLLPLVCCLIGFTALFLFSSVFDDLPDFLQRSGAVVGSRAQIALYFLLLQPANMVNVLPMSVLLASCFVVSRMGRHHELSAMRSAGIDLVRLALPIWLLAVVLCGVSFWIGEFAGPRCTARAARIYEAYTETPERLRRQAKLIYHNASGRRDWFFEVFQANGVSESIFVKQFSATDTIEWELRADTVEYRDGRWLFSGCEIVPFDPVSQLPIEDSRQRLALYEAHELDETPDRILNHVRSTEHLSVRGILAMLAANPDLPGHLRRSLRATLWFRLVSSLSCLVGALFGVGLSITRERGSAMRGFAYAVGLMVLYYVVGEIGLVLARKGHLPVVAGACLPALAFVVAGALIVQRRR
jgi:lipopolysaccharide export LptBFGC system permease protein LptF